jgi:hypothetical protein
MVKEKTTASFMAVAHGREATEESSVKRYLGVAAVKVLTINPNKETLSKILETENIKDEPNYLGKTTVKNYKNEDTEVPQVRLTFWVQTDPAMETNAGIDTKLSFTIFLSKGYRYSFKNGATKVQVIDKYGRTAWATQEDVKAKRIPQYISKKTGEPFSANISEGYRPMYIGEDELIGFIKAYLGLPEPTEWDDDKKVYVMRKDPSDAECMLDSIENYFKGDIQELRDIVSYQPNNKFKALFGIRTASNGNQYQACYTKHFLKLGNNRLSKLDEEIQGEYAENRLQNVLYEVHPLSVYKVTPTDYSEGQQPAESDGTNSAADIDPFAAAASGDDMPFGE